MVNVSNPLTSNYNLTGLTNFDMVNDPTGWLINFQSLSGVPIVGTALVGVGVVLFFIMRENVNSDSEALAYSGLITSIAGILLFLVKNGSGVPLVGWGFLVPIFLITAFSILANMIGRNY